MWHLPDAPFLRSKGGLHLFGSLLHGGAVVGFKASHLDYDQLIDRRRIVAATSHTKRDFLSQTIGKTAILGEWTTNADKYQL